MVATSCTQYHLEASYQQHAVVDDQAGVIVAVAVTTGEVSEGLLLPRQLEETATILGQAPGLVTADAGYAHGPNYAACEAQGIRPVIPPRIHDEKNNIA